MCRAVVLLTALAPLALGGGTACATSRPHLRPSGSSFVEADGAPFQWRGISAFRLVEMVAHGKKNEAAAFLDWAAGRRLTVVRVLTMAKELFPLDPADGVRALPELLQMASVRGLHVEVVALADTADFAVDIEAHVKAIGAIAAAHPNALVELANEPAHPTQSTRIHDPAELTRLRSLIPAGVPVALGSAEENAGFANGDYVTMHFPRPPGADGWGHVLALAGGALLVEKWRKPVISDEPIGAAAESIPGRRDNDPTRFRAAALLTRLAGLGATFHYEGGLQARIPVGRELECFEAWNEAWGLLPVDIEAGGEFRRGSDASSATAWSQSDASLGVFEREKDGNVWVLVVPPQARPVQWKEGWRPAGPPLDAGGATLLVAQRRK